MCQVPMSLALSCLPDAKEALGSRTYFQLLNISRGAIVNSSQALFNEPSFSYASILQQLVAAQLALAPKGGFP
jgi:hypothetical protein